MKNNLTKLISTMLSTVLLVSTGLGAFSVPVSAEEGKDRPIKILAIGNSYSNNATQYVSEIAESMGLDITAASLYYQGCELKRHVKHYETYEELGKSDYYKTDNKYKYEAFYVNGQSSLENLSIQEAVAYTDWDYITLQQMPNGCDDIRTYWTEAEPYLTKLYDYVRAELKKNGNKKCEILLHQGWSFSYEMSVNDAYKYYPVDYDTTADFFKKIESTVEEAADILKNHAGLKNAPAIVPSGKAVQLAKDEFGFGDSFGEKDSMYADYISHMSGIGKYLVACVWIETFAAKAGLSATDVRKATYVPTELLITNDTAVALRSCAHEAVTGESDTLFGDWRAVARGKALKIVRYYGEKPADGKITVPAELGDKTVREVADDAFKAVEGEYTVVREEIKDESDGTSPEEEKENKDDGDRLDNIGWIILGISAAAAVFLLLVAAAIIVIIKLKS